MAYNDPINGAPNFSIAELCRSDTAFKKGIYNIAPSEQAANLVYLAQKVLQPIRDHFGEPLIVTSGYRSPSLNSYIGGSRTSFHCHGCAADLQFGKSSNHSLLELFEYIYRNLPFSELIAEECPNGWIHVALQKGREDEKKVKYKLVGDVVRRASFAEVMKIMGANQ